MKALLRQFALLLALPALAIADLSSPVSSTLRDYRDAVYTTLYFNSVDLEQGLSHYSISSIARDRQGFVWIGTQSGLNRFDGTGLKIYRHEADAVSIPNDHISALQLGNEDRLWIGTLGGGLARLNLVEDRIELIPWDDATSTPGTNIIEDLTFDQAGNLWVATEDGIGVVAPGQSSIRKLASVTGRVRQVLATTGGVYVVTTDSLLSFETSRSNPTVVETGAHKVDFIEAHRDNNSLWLLSGTTLLEAQPRDDGSLALTERGQTGIENPRAMHADGWNSVWIGGIGGIAVFVPTLQKFVIPSVHLSESARSIRSLFIDDTEIWLGTNLEGLRYARLDDQVAVSRPTPGNVPIVTAAAIGERRVLLGEHPGLYLLDLRNLDDRPLLSADGDAMSIVSFLEVDDRIWFSATTGLGWVDKETLRANLSLHRTFEYPLLIAGRGNKLILSTGVDLVEVDITTMSLTTLQPLPRVAAKWTLDSDRALIGGFLGLSLYDMNCRCLTSLLDNFPANRPVVTAIHRSDDTTLWLGTHNEGLIEVAWDGTSAPPASAYTIRNTESGLAANAIGGIQQDHNGDLWLSTTVGISRYRTGENGFENYYPEQGTAERGYIIGAGTKGDTGEIVFGGAKGVTVIPSDIKPRGKPPKPVITDVRLANQSLSTSYVDKGSPLPIAAPFAKEIVLPYGSAALTFDFSTLVFPQPDALDYAYRLVPLESDWTHVIERRLAATYTSLSPGEYTFELANDPDRAQVTRFDITITPPWYLETWFIIAVILAFNGLLWVFVRTRTARIQARATELEHVVGEHTAELKKANEELTIALEQVKTLRGIVPICASCKKIRDDDGYWRQLEEYMLEHTEAEFSHGICSECMKTLYGEDLERK